MDLLPANPLCAAALGALGTLQYTSVSEYPATAQSITETLNEQRKTLNCSPVAKADVHKALAELIRAGLLRVQETQGQFRYHQTLEQRLKLSPPLFAIVVLALTQPIVEQRALYEQAYRLYPYETPQQAEQAAATLVQKRLLTPTLQGEHAGYRLSLNTATEHSTSAKPPGDMQPDPLRERINELETLVDRLLKPSP